MASESADSCLPCISGVLRFQRTEGDPKFETKKLKKGVEIVYASTGITASTTKVVGDVKAKKEADEKWFEEPKVSGEFHARDGSPVKDTDRFTTMTWETATQRQKVMYLAAISETEKIGLWEVDFADKSNVRKDGKPGKGLTAGLLVKYLKLMKKEAIKKLGPGVRMCMCMRMRMCMGTSPFVKIHFLW